MADGHRSVTERLRAHRVTFELRAAHHFAAGVERRRDLILIRVEKDGIVGWGECPSLSTAGYVGPTTDEIWERLASARPWRTVAAPMLHAAVADARLDRELRATGVPLADHLGATATAVPMCHVVAAEPRERLRAVNAALADARAEGDPAPMVKVKVFGPEVDALVELRDAVGPDVVIAADSNGTFGRPTDAARRAVERVGLAYLEQPTPPGEEVGEWPCPIALDETLTSLDSARRALDEAQDPTRLVISVKPARVGGVEAAARMVALARDSGSRWFVGGMLESGIGRAGAVAVAALDVGDAFPTDLGPSHRYVDVDLCDPVVVDGRGRLSVPTGPGIGRRVDPARLAERSTAVIDLDG